MTLVAVALVAAGAAGGWWLRGWIGVTTPVDVAVTVDRPVARPAPLADASTMPSLIGLSEDEARRVLADASVAADRIEVTQVPTAGRTGLVVSQDPGAGNELGGPVRLGIAVATDVPDVTGDPEDAAREALEDLGTRVVVDRAYEPGVAEGQVLGVQPGVGEPLPREVSLRVAAAPSSVLVTALEPVVEGCFEEDEISVDGTAVDDALACEGFGDDMRVLEYVLNREVAQLQAVLGQSDRGATGRRLAFRFLVDGQEVATHEVGHGMREPVEVPVQGGLRLRIEVSELNPPADCCDDELVGVLGDARLVGAPEAIDRLTQDAQS